MSTHGQGQVLMVQGTSSDAGKSFVVAGLLRWAKRRGISVAPFKAQNMALNAAVTPEGGEIGRAQAAQAEAAGIPAHVDMNPILLKPEAGFVSQLVVLGQPIGTFSWRDYDGQKERLRSVVLQALERLRARYQLVVVEGAGSPAEINLRNGDLVNMFVARSLGAPVLLVTDVDRGGAFASLYGTWALLPPEDRVLIRGFILNRIRGDAGLLESGYRELEAKTGVPTLGAIPFLDAFEGAEEDSLGLATRRNRPRAPWRMIEVTIIELPHLSNYDEFRLLEARVVVRYTRHPREGLGSDLVIVPGSKHTVSDLAWVKETGWAEILATRRDQGEAVLGICGGCQILGERLWVDEVPISGLGLLPVETRFLPEKRTTRVHARLFGLPGVPVAEGYEIHHGRLQQLHAVPPFAEIGSGDDSRSDGASVGTVRGTMIHGLFEAPESARALLCWAAPAKTEAVLTPLSDPHARSADALASLPLEQFFRRELSLLGGSNSPGG
ncbi:MAG: cobyric acid synthase [Myxococcales bacterium]|nr:cobyric acid synthase [Myxococcales bacterium]